CGSSRAPRRSRRGSRSSSAITGRARPSRCGSNRMRRLAWLCAVLAVACTYNYDKLRGHGGSGGGGTPGGAGGRAPGGAGGGALGGAGGGALGGAGGSGGGAGGAGMGGAAGSTG